jgi:hypothetical protein
MTAITSDGMLRILSDAIRALYRKKKPYPARENTNKPYKDKNLSYTQVNPVLQKGEIGRNHDAKNHYRAQEMP